MKILFIGARTYYGSDDSYEYLMLAGSLADMGHTVGFVGIEQPALIDRVESAVASMQPDCIIYHATAYEMDMPRFAALKGTKITLLADDDWRRDYGLQLAEHTDYVLANAEDSAAAYGAKFIPFQWGVRWSLYNHPPLTRSNAAAFVGMNYGYRGELVSMIQRAGVPIQCYGMGWEQQIKGADIPTIFRNSWVSINTSMSSDGKRRQIKGRNFEIPAGCALLLAENAPGLDRYYTDGVDAAFWSSPVEAIDKLLFYLSHKDALNKIAIAGAKRTYLEHTYTTRWNAIFKAAGL